MRKVFIISFLFFFCLGFAQSLRENLILQYDFEEISGTKVIDKSGNGNDGIITNMTNNFVITSTSNSNNRTFGKVFYKSVPGKPGHITSPLNLFKKGSADYSITLWICITNQLNLTCGNAQIVGYSPGSNTVNTNTAELVGIKDNYFVGFSNYDMPFPLDYLGETNESSNPVIINNWYHYAVVSSFSEDKTTLYVNGKQLFFAQGYEEYASLTTSTGALFIGRGAGGADQDFIFGGKLDDFRLYSKAMTIDDINAVMNENLLDVSGIEDKALSTLVIIPYKEHINIINGYGHLAKVYTMEGKLCKEKFVDNNDFNFDFFGKGFYLIKIREKVFKVLLS